MTDRGRAETRSRSPQGCPSEYAHFLPPRVTGSRRVTSLSGREDEAFLTFEWLSETYIEVSGSAEQMWQPSITAQRMTFGDFYKAVESWDSLGASDIRADNFQAWLWMAALKTEVADAAKADFGDYVMAQFQLLTEGGWSQSCYVDGPVCEKIVDIHRGRHVITVDCESFEFNLSNICEDKLREEKITGSRQALDFLLRCNRNACAAPEQEDTLRFMSNRLHLKRRKSGEPQECWTTGERVLPAILDIPRLRPAFVGWSRDGTDPGKKPFAVIEMVGNSVDCWFSPSQNWRLR